MSSFKYDVISDFKHVYLNTSFELKKHWKRNRIILASLLAIALPLLFYAVPPLTGGEYAETADLFAGSNLSYVTLLIIISAALFAGDTISTEYEKKTGLIIFPTPQRRNSIFVGKYIAALVSTWFAVLLYYLVTALEIVQIYGASEISIDFVKSFLLALLYSSSAVSIIFFFSSVMKRSIASALTGFFTLLMILPILSRVLIIANIDPWFIVTHSADLITNVLDTSGVFSPSNARVSNTSFPPGFYVGIQVILAYAIGFFIVALGIANRKKMEG